jgi:hypothetical protein
MKNENAPTHEMCSGSEEGSYLRPILFQSLNSRLERNEEEERTYVCQELVSQRSRIGVCVSALGN